LNKFILLIFIISPSITLFAQNIKGVIYDDITFVKDVSISNTTQDIKTYSNHDGSFNINAAITDTLVIQASFYKTQNIILSTEHFTDMVVIKLNKIMTKLNEVYITSKPILKEFEANTYTIQVNKQIQEDMKRRPYLYRTSNSGNINVIAIAKFISRLLKNDDTKNKTDQMFSYDDLKLLFETDTYFNEHLLRFELKITNDYKYLFFQYCESKQIDKSLLSNKSNFLLLEVFITSSKEFLKILEDYKED